MALVNFKEIGRNKKTWMATCKTEDDIEKELKKALMSNDIGFVLDAHTDVYKVFAGVRPVGTFTLEGTLEIPQQAEIDENIEAVIKAADVVCWSHACNSSKKKGAKNPTDLKGSIEDLTKAMEKLELSKYVVVYG